ncbi:hypothetical protein M409DRAFT_52620 [Zasmidium cellare ATCC 36951]|uniref:Uncharacterized protein n=1 Tax=Zasmidium cellare ATCC 36951 TaxID=1080233 RepID=A0A6A6CU69_ZASCE|nr:uncharacterized protein M409DRAFT_52620 [Zasmidium cellare ATCC 36951]KAF2169372.1 hypothetical protein M409DRAFT_52620 [Zasmidium cellare ATCC 36951]
MANQAATSFDCDGCSHHASFHSLENESEDAVLKKWAAIESSNNQSQATGGSNRKRRRITEEAGHEIEILELTEDDKDPAWVAPPSRHRSQKQTRRTAKTSSGQGRDLSSIQSHYSCKASNTRPQCTRNARAIDQRMEGETSQEGISLTERREPCRPPRHRLLCQSYCNSNLGRPGKYLERRTSWVV